MKQDLEAMRTRTPSPTSFTASLMPETVHRREPHPFSVHYNVETRRWVATLTKIQGEGSMSHVDSKKSVFCFSTEREARKFAKSYSPPKLVPPSSECMLCSQQYNARVRPCHCRNCGSAICDKCSKRWSINMMPKTYLVHLNSLTVRVCKTCDWLSNAFCMALIQGKYDDALALYNTRNVNLRSSFADINREAMFPVHCAVLGGNLDLLRFLVDTHLCPVSVKQDRAGRPLSLQTSRGRTLIDIAMTGKPKLDILRYLVSEKQMKVTDTRDSRLASRTLEVLLRGGMDVSKPINPGDQVHLIESTDDSVTTVEDACILCCEKSMDSVLIPCGHQVCCNDCGKHLLSCPVCKIQCSVLRIFRQ